MPGTPFGAFAADVLALYSPRMRRKSTRSKMRQVLAEFGQLCATCDDLTPAAIAAWLDAHAAKERRPATLLSLLRTLRAACSYGRRAGAMTSSPFEFRRPEDWIDADAPELEPPVHTAGRVARVLALADREAAEADRDAAVWRRCRLRALTYAAAFTGARRNELLGMRSEDVDPEMGKLSIRSNARRKLKTRKSAADLPMPRPLAAVLSGWLPQCDSEWLFPGVRRKSPWLGGPYGERAIDELKALGLRAGVDGLTFQSLRHTFASLSESWGIGELMLQRLLRHTSVRTQRGYRHPLPDSLREAGDKVHFS